jgi:hypothetical protein
MTMTTAPAAMAARSPADGVLGRRDHGLAVEEFQLPELEARGKPVLDQSDVVREGWDKHGARSRLDRRRTVKEAVKRRAVQAHPLPFTSDDLRFRQLVPQPKPSSSAVLFFMLDVSSSMSLPSGNWPKPSFSSHLRTAPQIPQYRNPLPRPRGACLGIQRGRVLRSQRHGRHDGLDRFAAGAGTAAATL